MSDPLFTLQGASRAQTAEGVCWFYSDAHAISALDLAANKVLVSFPSEHSWFGVGSSALLVGTEVLDRHGKRKARLALAELEASVKYLHTRSIDDAGTVAVGSLIDELLVWDARTGKLLHRETIAKLNQVAVDPLGSTVAISRWEKPLQLLDLKTFTKRTVDGVMNATSMSLRWSPDAKRLVAYDLNKGFLVDPKAGTPLGTPFKLKGASGAAFLLGRSLLLVAQGKKLSAFDADSGAPGIELKLPAKEVAVSKDDRHVIAVDGNRVLSVWSPEELLGQTKPAAAKPKKPTAPPAARPTTPQATSTGVYFGISSKNSHETVLAAGRALHHILDRQPPNFAVRVVTIDETTWFSFVGTRGRNYLLEPWIEVLMETLQGPLIVILRQGEDLFAQRYTTPWDAEPVEVDDAHLGTRDVSEPWMLVEGGTRPAVKKPVTKKPLAKSSKKTAK
jgi:hypothetical protein